MRVFVTGATGFIGSVVVEDLIDAGHEVIGLCRSEAKAAALVAAGAQVHPGSVEDVKCLQAGVALADGVIHLAFNHDFSKYLENGETDLRAVSAMAEALAASGKPFIVTSGMTAVTPGRSCTEADPAEVEGMLAVRGRPEARALAARDEGVRSVVVRLPPSVHDRERQGLVSQLIDKARQTGVSAYAGEGANRWAAVHRRDAARLFRLALEGGEAGQRIHAVAEEGVALRSIAQAIGERLGMPIRGLDAADVAPHFGWLGFAVSGDMPASSAITRESLGWRPTQPGLLDGLQGAYLA